MRKFPQYVNFADFTVTYRYSENLIRENLLVCNNYRFVTVHKMLPFHDEPVIHENIIAKILFTSCPAKIPCRENFHIYGTLVEYLWCKNWFDTCISACYDYSVSVLSHLILHNTFHDQCVMIVLLDSVDLILAQYTSIMLA